MKGFTFVFGLRLVELTALFGLGKVDVKFVKFFLLSEMVNLLLM